MKSRRHCSARSVRNGFTILELILSLGLASSLAAGTVVLVSLAQKSSGSAKGNLQKRMDVRRFADQFRRDVHSASDLRIDGTTLTLTVPTSGDVITYSSGSSESLSRIVEDAAGNPSGRDRFRVGKNLSIKVEAIDRWGAVKWTLQEQDQTRPPIEILAVPNREVGGGNDE